MKEKSPNRMVTINSMVIQLKTIWKNGVVPTRKSPALSVVHKSNSNNETKRNDELKIPFDQWTMPPQPVGYIKFHGFDFF